MELEMYRLLKISIVSFGAGCLLSCVSPTASHQGGVDGEVVERSREKAPAWAGLPLFKFHDQVFTLGYLHVEKQHPDLPLGIKKTQLNALLQGKDAFRNELKTSISEAASTVHLNYDQIASHAGSHVDEVSEQSWSANAKVADIFFEKFRPTTVIKGPLEVYNIFVLVEVPKSAMSDALRSVATRFKNSSQPDLKKIGAAIDTRKSVSH